VEEIEHLEMPSITPEIIAALAKSSDNFGFELRVGRLLHEFQHATVRHADTYLDHRTGEERQFDYQCVFRNEWRQLQLAIECKNFFLDSPAVVYGHRRIPSESFHDLIFTGNGILDSGKQPKHVQTGNVSEVLRHGPESDLYPVSDTQRNFVGKGVFKPLPPKDGKPGTAPLLGFTVGKDSEEYDRWNQALGSAGAMVLQALEFKRARDGINGVVTVTLPVFALPDGALWQLEFDDAGEITGSPVQVDHSTLYRAHRVRNDKIGTPFYRSVTLPHVEFFTLTGLRHFLNTLNDSTALVWETTFPEALVKKVDARFQPSPG
jgi:hypothetical protein